MCAEREWEKDCTWVERDREKRYDEKCVQTLLPYIWLSVVLRLLFAFTFHIRITTPIMIIIFVLIHIFIPYSTVCVQCTKKNVFSQISRRALQNRPQIHWNTQNTKIMLPDKCAEWSALGFFCQNKMKQKLKNQFVRLTKYSKAEIHEYSRNCFDLLFIFRSFFVVHCHAQIHWQPIRAKAK